MESRTERRTVKHNFTNDELLVLSEDMAVKNQELRHQEDEKKSVLSQYSSHINELKESISSLATKVANKFEHREVECTVEFHTPERDVKTLTRKDNGAIWTERMTDFDYDLFNQFDGSEESGSMVFESKMNSEDTVKDSEIDADQAEYESRMENEISSEKKASQRKGSSKKGTLKNLLVDQEESKSTF